MNNLKLVPTHDLIAELTSRCDHIFAVMQTPDSKETSHRHNKSREGEGFSVVCSTHADGPGMLMQLIGASLQSLAYQAAGDDSNELLPAMIGVLVSAAMNDATEVLEDFDLTNEEEN